MPDKKVTSLDQVTGSRSANDLLMIVQGVGGTPVNKKDALALFLRDLPANTVVKGTFTVQANSLINGSNSVFSANVNIFASTRTSSLKVANSAFILTERQTPANATITIAQGSMFYDNSYFYIATSNNVVRRVAHSTW